ncbi:MAG: ABC transporter substrate-binding protein [Ancrocorticia sp.]
MTTLTPTRSALLAGVTALALALSACGGTDESAAEKPSGEASGEASSLLPPAEGKTQYPLTLKTPWGETTLEERPERIIAATTNATDVELLLALDVTPVLISQAVVNAPWLEEHGSAEIETFSFDSDLPLETFAAADADLITAFDGDLTDSYKRISEIAPIAAPEKAVEGGDYYSGVTWQEELRILGKALDLSDRAEKVIAQHDDRLKLVREEHPEFAGKTATFLVWFGEAAYGLSYFSTPGSPAENFFSSLGFTTNPLAKNFADADQVSFEQMALVDADVLILNDSSHGELEKVTGNELFAKLSAVQDKRLVTIIDGDDGNRSPIGWAIATQGPLGTQFLLEDFVPELAKTLN